MVSSKIIKKIKYYSIISVLLPFMVHKICTIYQMISYPKCPNLLKILDFPKNCQLHEVVAPRLEGVRYNQGV